LGLYKLLRRTNMRGSPKEGEGAGSRDVTVDFDFPETTEMSLGCEIQVRIAEANGGLCGKAYVGLQYPLFEADLNAEGLGAEIVTPGEAGIPRVVPIGTILTIRLIRR
jgi:hypothetical protein